MANHPPALPRSQKYEALLFIGDPHLAATPPGYRIDDYRRTILDKLAFCLDLAARQNYLPIILGDLFHLPRNNPNHLLVDVMELFRPLHPWVLVGNHDKHEARLTRDVSLAVLEAAGVIKLLAQSGSVATIHGWRPAGPHRRQPGLDTSPRRRGPSTGRFRCLGDPSRSHLSRL